MGAVFFYDNAITNDLVLSEQLNSCQAKDKSPRPFGSERSRKADGKTHTG